MSFSRRFGRRKKTLGRLPQNTKHEVLLDFLDSQSFYQIVKDLAEKYPESHTGRPRSHSTPVLALMYLLIADNGYQGAKNYLSNGNAWNTHRRKLIQRFDGFDGLTLNCSIPSKTVCARFKNIVSPQCGESLQTIFRAHAYSCAVANGLGINHGTLLDPSQSACLYGDGTTIAPVSLRHLGETWTNPRTGKKKQRRFDPDAEYFKTGGGKNVYGHQFVLVGASNDDYAKESIILAVAPIIKGDDDKGSETAVAIHEVFRLKTEHPGFAALLYDKALRGTTINKIWAMGLHPIIPVYDKKNFQTKEQFICVKTINGIKVPFYAVDGAFQIKTHDGYFPLKIKKLERKIRKKNGTYRWHGTYEITSEIPCDFRLHGQTFTLRTDKEGEQELGEYIRAHNPKSEHFRALYGRRNEAESVNAMMKSHLGPNRRARSYGRQKVWIDLMFQAMLRNHEAMLHHRARIRDPISQPA